jgi:hypothetical protein
MGVSVFPSGGYPDRCGNGHPLVPGNVSLGWFPCGCAGTRGHNYASCWTCRWEFTDPPHDPAVPAQMWDGIPRDATGRRA